MGIFGRRRETRTAIDQNIVDILEMLARVEQRIARFYHLCAETVSDEKNLWRKMAASERQHVKYLQQMREIYLQHPHQFQTDYPFNTAAIRLFELSLRDLPGRAELEETDRKVLLGIVEKIESSAVEMNYGKVIRSDNADFNRLAAKLDAESKEHRQVIASMASES